MVGLLLAAIISVNYDLVEEERPFGQINNNYSLFAEPEVKPEPKTIEPKKVPRFVRKPKNNWIYKKNETKEELADHLKTHPNHKETFAKIPKADLLKYDLSTLKDLHSLDHEHTLQSSFFNDCALSKSKNKRILYFTSNSCPACRSCYAQFMPWLRKAGWKIGTGSDSHIQVINVDSNPRAMSRYGVSSLPSFVVIDDDRVVKKTGYLSKEKVPKLLEL